MKPGDSVQLFTMPERLAEVAEVEFITEDPSLASYEDGKVTRKRQEDDRDGGRYRPI